jgi:hypothetical protein
MENETLKTLKDMLWLLEMSDNYDYQAIKELENKINQLENNNK